MHCSKVSRGFGHVVLLLLLGALIVCGGFFLFALRNNIGVKKNSASAPVKGASSHQVVAPTSQIAFIPKNECTVFVSLTGNDSNTGATETQALRTIQKAVDTMGPGAVVCIKGGAYRQAVSITNKMGTPSSPMKIGGYSEGGLPILTGGILPNDQYKLPSPLCTTELDKCAQRGSAGECKDRHPCIYGALLSVNNSDYLSIIGIDTRGSSGTGTVVAASNHIFIKGVRSYHNWNSGFKLQGNTGAGEGGIDNKVENVAVYDNIRAYAEKRFIGGSGFVAVGVTGGYLKNSLVFENFGEGLDVGRGASEFVLENNMAWENFHSSLYVNAARNVSVKRNFVFCTGGRVNWMESNGAPIGPDSYGTGITVRNETGGSAKHGVGGGTVVANNSIVGCTKGLVVGTQKNSPLKDMRVLNNSILSTRNAEGKAGTGLTMSLGENSNFENVVVANNIITVSEDVTALSVLGGNSVPHAGVRFINNFSNIAPRGVNSGFRVVDPQIASSVSLNQLLDPAHVQPESYTITQGSPVIDTAQVVAEGRNEDKLDLFGNQRTADVFDAGSYEFGQPKNWSNLYAIVMQGIPDDDDPPAAVCGNGTQEQGEACDLGSTNGVCPATCSALCTLNECDDLDGDPSQNVLRNSGFRIGATETTEFAKYWSFAKGKLGNAAISLINAPANTLGRGKVAKLEVISKPIKGFPSISQKNVDLDPNSQYEISFVARSSENAPIVVAFRDMGYIETLLAPTIRFNLGTSWATYSANVTTTAFDPNKAARIYVGYGGPAGSTLLMDTIRVRKIQ